ncbi:MAG TPA: hypothetical protein VNJ70_10230 [Thermoanaerobaculia bacterium]|nr:hypothetical protein [Thermoanaerobaculia bacterium]
MSTVRSLISCAALAALLCGADPAAAGKCDTDAVPAATLLFPYFEVDLDDPFTGRTTLIAITNQDEAPVLAKAVLWTEWAIPTLDFEIYLAGYDVQTLNLRDIFVSGRLPRTGSGVSPHGNLSGPPVAFPGCNGGTTPGAAPVYADPAIAGAALAELRDFHTGRCTSGGMRAAPPSEFHEFDGQNVARGYVTVDVVKRCSGLSPADGGYFAADATGVAGDRNVLTGDFFLVDVGQNFAQGELAVHVEAFPGGFSPGDYTFYKRYVAGSGIDGREPLGTQYEIRHLLGGAFDGGTKAIIWRDTGSPAAVPVACDDSPPWFGECGLKSYRVLFNEDGEATHRSDACLSDVLPTGGEIMPAPNASQLATYGNVGFYYTIPTPFPFGHTRLVLRDTGGGDPNLALILQSWVSVINSAENRYSVGQRAIRLDSACAPAPVKPAPFPP